MDGFEERRYVRTGWTDPGIEASDAETDEVDRVLRLWLRERRRLAIVATDGTTWEAQLIGIGGDALYFAGRDGQARIVFRQGLREIRAYDRDGAVTDGNV